MSKSNLACLYAIVCVALFVACAATATITGVGGWWVPAVIFAIVSFTFALHSIENAAN